MEERIVKLEQCGALLDESFPGMADLINEQAVLFILQKGANDISVGIPSAIEGARASGEQSPGATRQSSLARTMPTDRILTCRCDTTLVGRGRSSD